MMNPNQHEWLKIVLSTIAGLMAGLVAEPFKTWIQDRITVLKIRRVLHRELVRLENQFSMGSALKEATSIDRSSRELASFKAEAFEHYFETQRALFYSDNKLSEMRHVLEQFKTLQSDLSKGIRTYHDTREWGMGTVKDAIALGIFNEKLITKYRTTQHNFQVTMVMAGIGILTKDDRWPPRAKLWGRIKHRISSKG
jgi:hypothetical protein